MTTIEERNTFAKLDALKDIRSKTICVEKLRHRLLNDLESVESEEKCLAEYRREMELLQQEKMAHVEELRQIHADINALENVMKQAEESRRSASVSAKIVFEDFIPLKNDVDSLRSEILGLDKITELSPSDKERLNGIGVFETKALTSGVNHAITAPKTAFDHPWLNPAFHVAAAAANRQDVAGNKNFASLMSGLGRSHQHTSANAFLAAQQHSAIGFGQLQAAKSVATTSASTNSSAINSQPAFRQQPPPMKSCLSCHQQIHRNAPICPLCKAKSRSRNPKKPKKKE